MTTRGIGRRAPALFVASLLVVCGAAQAQTSPEDGDMRVSVSKHLRGDGRDNAELIRESRDEFAALTLQGKRKAGPRTAMKPTAGKPATGAAQGFAANEDFWFYLADVELYADDDRDGYFSGIDLLFDVDTIYNFADVYAVAYLSYEGGPWEEYAETADFTIFGASGSDDYVIVTDLVSGYPTGSYDILIEVFDADTGEFLAWYGPEDTSELSFLPLEDMDRDAPRGGTTVVVNNGGGGATSAWLLALLGVIAARARRRPAPGRVRFA